MLVPSHFTKARLLDFVIGSACKIKSAIRIRSCLDQGSAHAMSTDLWGEGRGMEEREAITYGYLSLSDTI